MLNKDGQRELAYVVKIDELRPIPNYDRVEHARVGGWWVIVKKDQFQVGDPAIYIEVDSRVPEKEPFMFLEKKHFKVKTQKMCKVISQGLLMHPNDFGWEIQNDNLGGYVITATNPNRFFEVGDFLTKELEITYAEAEDNRRKAPSIDKYKKMAQRRPEIFKHRWARWMMKRDWGKKVMFFFFGKKKDKRNSWPAWVVKTDEERCQNMPWLFPGDGRLWLVTEKIDGTSTTFTIKGRGRKEEFIVCSRNVAFDEPNKNCYYDTNVYLEMAEKYDIHNVLKRMMNDYPAAEFITIQGETYGEGIQKRTYGLKEHDFKAFNLIIGRQDSVTRFNPFDMTCILEKYNIPCVPILDMKFQIPETCDELLEYAEGNSVLDGEMREGVVIRSCDGEQSFKAVSNKFLLKYHS